MPFKSKAQQRYFQYLESKGKMPKKSVPGLDEEMGHYAHGGEVPESYDEEMGEAEEYDSSGEPHTEDKFEDEQPMEYMSRGGRVKRMSRGGMVSHPSFAKALRKAI